MVKGRADEAALTADIVALATRYGRYGYRRITAMLHAEGWAVNGKSGRLWARGHREDACGPVAGRVVGRGRGECHGM